MITFTPGTTYTIDRANEDGKVERETFTLVRSEDAGRHWLVRDTKGRETIEARLSIALTLAYQG